MVRTLAVAGLLLGLAAPVIYAMQSLEWRVAMERAELGNIEAIVTAARGYAHDHGGVFPPDLETLVKEGKLRAESLRTPFSAFPDYVYAGKDLTLAKLAGAGDEGAALMLVHGKDLRFNMGAVGFADGRAEFLQAEDLDRALGADAAARAKLGLPPATTEAADAAARTR